MMFPKEVFVKPMSHFIYGNPNRWAGFRSLKKLKDKLTRYLGHKKPFSAMLQFILIKKSFGNIELTEQKHIHTLLWTFNFAFQKMTRPNA